MGDMSRFKLNHGGIQSYLDGDHGVSAILHSKANAVASVAVASAPVDSGDYASSIHIEEDRTDRLAVRVVAGVDYSHVVEADTGNLARALDAAG